MRHRDRVAMALAREVPDRCPMQISFTPEFAERLRADLGVRGMLNVARGGEHNPHGGGNTYELERAIDSDLILTSVGWANSYYQGHGTYTDEWGVTWQEHPYETPFGTGHYTEMVGFPLAEDGAIDSYMPARSAATGAVPRLRSASSASTATSTGSWASRSRPSGRRPGRCAATSGCSWTCSSTRTSPSASWRSPSATTWQPRSDSSRWAWTCSGPVTTSVPSAACSSTRPRGGASSSRAWRSSSSRVKAIKPDLLVAYHTDGDVREVIPDLIEIGIDVLNPVQPACMDPAELKRDYGDRLLFWGSIDEQGTLPFGSPAGRRRRDPPARRYHRPRWRPHPGTHPPRPAGHAPGELLGHGGHHPRDAVPLSGQDADAEVP